MVNWKQRAIYWILKSAKIISLTKNSKEFLGKVCSRIWWKFIRKRILNENDLWGRKRAFHGQRRRQPDYALSDDSDFHNIIFNWKIIIKTLLFSPKKETKVGGINYFCSGFYIAKKLTTMPSVFFASLCPFKELKGIFSLHSRFCFVGWKTWLEKVFWVCSMLSDLKKIGKSDKHLWKEKYCD